MDLHLPHTRPAGTAATAGAAAMPVERLDTSLLPRRVSWRAALALDAILLLGVARAAPTLAEPRAVVAWLAALAFAATFPLTAAQPRAGRPLAVVVGLWALCGIALQALSVGGIAFLITIVAIIQASRVAVPLGAGLALAGGLGYEAASVAVQGLNAGGLLGSSLGLFFAYLSASSFWRLREEKRKTEALLHEVLAGRDAQVRAAALDERARIAREIHDILAHTLSALAVQLEGTRLLVEQRPGDPAALAALERAGSLAREGLEETKRAFSTLRGEALPGPDELPDLVAAFERDTGIPCRLAVEGAPVALAPEAGLALYRTAQEALTNVRKHAAATSVAVGLRYAAGEATLTVEDEGAARPSPLPGGGHGLDGMRERAALARGRLEAGPTPSGFRVHLWLPA